MREILKSSFRKRLTASFLLVSLGPLLLCSAMLFEIFRIKLTENSEREASEQLTGVGNTLSEVCDEFRKVADDLTKKRALIRELTREDKKDIQVYKELFSLTERMRSYARFDIYDKEGKWRYSTRNYTPSENMPTDTGIFYKAQNSSDMVVFMPQTNYAKEGKPILQGICIMYDKDENILGYLLMSLDDRSLQKLFEGKHFLQNELIIMNKYWRPVYSSRNEMDEEKLNAMRCLFLDGKNITGIDSDFSYTVSYNEPMSVYLILKHPEEFASGTLKLLYTVIIFTGLICIAISIFISLKLSCQMSKPIEELHRAIDEVGNNNLGVKVSSKYDDELGQLVSKFDNMVRALKINQEQMVENQRELNEAQIRMLQAQLNPHFLCNTLDTMKWISKINKVPQVALMSTNLADILRFCISPQEFVLFERELEVLERYIEIQKIRLSDDFELKLDVPEEIYCCLVPKMILQPIVENAILHGLEGVKKGEIRVAAKVKQNDILEITVEDNGNGLPKDMVGSYCHKDKDKLKGHLGLYNVDTILVKYYGEGFGLYLENIEDGCGARVTATLPFKKGDAEQC